MLSAQNSQSLTIILISLLGKRHKMAFKSDAEPLPELQYKTLNQSFLLQLPPTPQAPTTIKIGHCKLSWVNNFQIQIRLRIFFSSSSHYLSVCRLIFPNLCFWITCAVIILQVIPSRNHMWVICWGVFRPSMNLHLMVTAPQLHGHIKKPGFQSLSLGKNSHFWSPSLENLHKKSRNCRKSFQS